MNLPTAADEELILIIKDISSTIERFERIITLHGYDKYTDDFKIEMFLSKVKLNQIKRLMEN